MEKRNTNLVAALLVIIAVLGYGLIGKAGSLEPNDPPAPTMKTLQEIYDAVIEGSSGVSEREGVFENIDIGDGQQEPFLTVPDGKRFVLLKLMMPDYRLHLMVDDEAYIHGYYFKYTLPAAMYGTYVDFPDRCIVFDAGQVLEGYNYSGDTLSMAIVGYFYDVP